MNIPSDVRRDFQQEFGASPEEMIELKREAISVQHELLAIEHAMMTAFLRSLMSVVGDTLRQRIEVFFMALKVMRISEAPRT